MPAELSILAVDGIGEVVAGADIGRLVADAAAAQGIGVIAGDVVVIAQKIVSKAEGRVVAVADRTEIREVVRREARRIVRETPGHMIVETRHGFICANAGVDASNTQPGTVLLLPRDPDASARRIRQTLLGGGDGKLAVIIADTFGRAWRNGQTNVAIGSAGISALRNYRGQFDPAGRELMVTELAQVDELAGAAELVMGKLDRVPAAIIRGYDWQESDGCVADLVRRPERDLFR